jgi:N utilization substance protein B
MASRRRARSIALQALYEVDTTTHRAEEVLARHVYDDSVGEDAFDFISAMVQGVMEHRHQLDMVIQRHAPAFPVQQMAAIDRNILRMALFEMKYCNNVPFKVSINEAVELAKSFGSDASPRLVNGVLGAVVDEETGREKGS